MNIFLHFLHFLYFLVVQSNSHFIKILSPSIINPCSKFVDFIDEMPIIGYSKVNDTLHP